MRGSDFIFDSVQLLHCKCHKIGQDSPDWIKKKKTINPKKMMMINAFEAHKILKKLEKTHEKVQVINHLQIIITRMK